ncbi:MAG: UDP-N-acetylmuramoylalanyl-D-glutamyl-2, 6-diaminopimelate--D-alanyl-D-alanine ligase, partial [Chloroflexi bacterium]|nr:UDP-N-acetylmuramoylalanyl-D-glutamyl-2, 6-diaminopimelate--D-alanyl-D-alanine ligase [Chloroflexota bacterium]
MLTLGDILAGLHYDLPPACGPHPAVTRAAAGVAFANVVVDSRQVKPGTLFVALRGEHSDGHAYVRDALKRGATGALVQHTEALAGLTVPILRATDPPSRARELAPPVLILVDDTLLALQRIAGYWRALFDVPAVAITGSVGKTTAKEVIAGVLAQRYQVFKNPGNMNNELGLPLTLLQLTDKAERAVLEMGTYAQGEIDLLCR